MDSGERPDQTLFSPQGLRLKVQKVQLYGQPREAAVGGQLGGLVDGGAHVQAHHVHARHHDLAQLGIAQLEDRTGPVDLLFLQELGGLLVGQDAPDLAPRQGRRQVERPDRRDEPRQRLLQKPGEGSQHHVHRPEQPLHGHGEPDGTRRPRSGHRRRKCR